MTWNIHGGVGPDGLHDLERMLAVVQRADPDILALQEVELAAREGRGASDRAFKACARTSRHRRCRDNDSRWRLWSGAAQPLAARTTQSSMTFRYPVASRVARSRPPSLRPRDVCFVVAAHLGLRFIERRRQCSADGCARRAVGVDHGPSRRFQRLDVARIGPECPRPQATWPHAPAHVSGPTAPSQARPHLLPTGSALVSSQVDPAGADVSDHLPIADIDPARVRFVMCACSPARWADESPKRRRVDRRYASVPTSATDQQWRVGGLTIGPRSATAPWCESACVVLDPASRQLTTVICRCIALDMLHLALLLKQLRILGRSVGPAREPFVKVPAMFADSVSQCMHHSRSARLGSSLDSSETFFGARDQFPKVCNFLLVSREHMWVTR